MRLGKAADILPTLEDCFELVFIDADKRNYIQYVELLIERQMLADGAILVIDNTLWKGLVLQQVCESSSYCDSMTTFRYPA